MKSLWLLFPLGLLLGSCKEKPVAPSGEPNPPQLSDSGSTGSALSSQSTRAPLSATPEQLGSVLRVRVAFGGLPPKDTVGALLHRDEIANKALVQGYDRYVIALLKGWTEAQVNSPESHFIVYRNKVNANGRTNAITFPLRLVRFDPKTSLATLRYRENFEYSMDVGFHLDRRDFAHEDIQLLRVSRAPESSGAPQEPIQAAQPAPATPFPGAHAPFHRFPPGMPEAVRNQFLQRVAPQANLPAFLVDTGEYLGSKGTSGLLRFPRNIPQADLDGAYLAVGSPDKLSGFVEESPGGAPAITPVGQILVDLKTPVVKVTRLSFEGANGAISIKAQFDFDPPNFSPVSIQMRMAESPPASLDESAKPNAEGYFTPIKSQQSRTLLRFAGATDWKSGFAKIEAGAEKAYLVQFVWPLFENDGGESRAYGQPFLVRLAAKTDGIYPNVEGLPGVFTETVAHVGGPAAASAAAPLSAPLPTPVDAGVTPETGPVSTFALEAAVRNSHLMAGGREALFELEGPPYWKRFSFDKNAWMPLPPGDLSNASLTGNLSALFVLDRATGEVRKYLLPGLQPAGAVKLPGSIEYVNILAGCNSDHAPVHILAGDEAMALAPETLQRRDVAPAKGHIDPNGDRKFLRTERYTVTGDGLAIGNVAGSRRTRHYNSDARGLEFNYFDTQGSGATGLPLGVTGAFRMSSNLESVASPGGRLQTVVQKLPWNWSSGFSRLAGNAPVIFHFARALDASTPPSPALIRCLSYFDFSPFAVVAVPEYTDNQSFPRTAEWEHFDWILFDPYSFRLGTIAQDRKTWRVHSLVRPQKLDQPVLLNWPDTSVPRGEEFRFKPLFLGGDQFTAEIFARPNRATVNSADGTIRSPWGALDFDCLELLNLKVPGKGIREITYPISLHAVGAPPPFVAKASVDHKDLNLLGSGFKTLERPANEFRLLPSTIHVFKDQIMDIQGPISGCAALVTVANRIDFLSLQTRKIVGSTVASASAFYYAGSGALIEYDPGKRSLTRISVPDGRRERSITLPPNVTIAGLGAGTDSGSPITLALSITQGQSVTRFSDLTITSTEYRNLLTVLDGNTLQASGWAQPVSLAHILNQPAQDAPFAFMTQPGEKPAVLPASHNGSIVTMPNFLLVVSPSYSVSYPFGNQDSTRLHVPGELPMSGSISGLMATSENGEVFKGGSKVPGGPGFKVGSTPCGRYRMLRFPSGNPLDEVFGVQLAETGTQLLVGGRFSFFQKDPFAQLAHRISRYIAMLGDDGPLAILSPTGRELQLLDLDIPVMMKSLEPTEFHVVSQPVPCVMEGGALQYQVKVNNPDAVKTIRLQSPTPGAIVSSQGVLSFTAPAHITAHTQINIAIEIEGKNGNTVLHEFPIFVLPRPRATAKPQVGPI